MAKSLTPFLAGWVLLGAVCSTSERALAQKSYQVSFESKVPVAIRGSLGIPIQAVSHVVPLRDRLIVLETETNALRVVSTDGRVLSVKPNTGPGGAMLGRAIRAAPTSTGELLVLDVQRPRIARFRLDEDDLRYLGAAHLEDFANVSSLCSVAGRTFVLGQTLKEPGSLIAVVGQNGAVLSAFGRPFGPANASRNLQTTLRVGTISCHEAERMVVAVSALLPEVRAYSLDGRLKWTSKLPGLVSIGINETPNGIRYSYPVVGHWDSVSDSFALGGGIVGIQVARRNKEVSEPSSFRTFLLDASSGSIKAVQFDLPQLVGNWSRGVVALDSKGIWIMAR